MSRSFWFAAAVAVAALAACWDVMPQDAHVFAVWSAALVVGIIGTAELLAGGGGPPTPRNP